MCETGLRSGTATVRRGNQLVAVFFAYCGENWASSKIGTALAFLGLRPVDPRRARSRAWNQDDTHLLEETMTRTDLSAFRKRLEALMSRFRDERAQLRHGVLGDEREAEVSTTQEQYTTDDLSREKADEEVAQSLLDNEETLLAECEAALERIDLG